MFELPCLIVILYINTYLHFPAESFSYIFIVSPILFLFIFAAPHYPLPSKGKRRNRNFPNQQQAMACFHSFSHTLTAERHERTWNLFSDIFKYVSHKLLIERERKRLNFTAFLHERQNVWIQRPGRDIHDPTCGAKYTWRSNVYKLSEYD